MLKPIAIFGGGGFGLEVAMLIEQINHALPQWNLLGFFDDTIPVGTGINNKWSVLGGIGALNDWREPLAVVFALGFPGPKLSLIEKIDNPNIWHPTLFHPSVIIGPSDYVEIGEGGIICAGNIITTNIHIGKHVLLNLACTVGHETLIGDYCAFMPGCHISGEVKIGKASFWGTGAKIINQCYVGDFTTIGAGAVVIDNIPDHATAVGVPARVIKRV
jgi:sugar O-acyltransferase (sialic acid O-acetyltransferase NeuD family)